MFFIPGIVITLATFPGVIVHEFAHEMFCKICRVPVLEVKYLGLENPSGYVLHAPVSNFFHSFIISFGPFFLNSLLCMLICFPAFIPIELFDTTPLYSVFCIWLGISIGAHAIPSTQDAQNVMVQAKREVEQKRYWAYLFFPLVWGVNLLNLLRFFWVDVIYAFVIGGLLPKLLL